MAQSPEDNLETNSNSDDDLDHFIRCVKLKLTDNLAELFKNKDLEQVVETVDCDNNLLENVTLNYVIAKKIISTLSWREKILCQQVCTTWHSAVLALQKEQLRPTDFVLDMQICAVRDGVHLKVSNICLTEPLVILTFVNTSGFGAACKCDALIQELCTPPCEKEHSLIDIVHTTLCAPKDCMLTVRASYLSYMPLPYSPTYAHLVTPFIFELPDPFLGGLLIPVIPNVEFKLINIKFVDNMQHDFFEVVDKLAETRTIKGVLVYVTENFLLHSVEQIVFLNYFQKIQPDIPHALGGCIVEDAIHEEDEIKQLVEGVNTSKDISFISQNLVSIGLFTIPKGVGPEDYANFDMYSLVIDSSDWKKIKIQKTINEFAKKVPRFEHSVVIKLSCVGRNLKHELEQECFRAAFPYTRMAGCYGNGELGINHPSRPPPSSPPPCSAKRHRRDPGPQFGIMHSYSTVFVYMGWGRVTAQPQCP